MMRVLFAVDIVKFTKEENLTLMRKVEVSHRKPSSVQNDNVQK